MCVCFPVAFSNLFDMSSIVLMNVIRLTIKMCYSVFISVRLSDFSLLSHFGCSECCVGSKLDITAVIRHRKMIKRRLLQLM